MSNTHKDVDPTKHPAGSGSGRSTWRLPTGQPARAAVVVLAYVLAVSAVSWALEALYGMLGLIVAGLFAAVLTVPVAVLAPSPRASAAEELDERPILLRNVSGTPPSA